MPFGVSWGAYIRFTTAALVSMLAGAQMVHMYYRPLDDMEEEVKREVSELSRQAVELDIKNVK